jgi:hypothetical protein
MRPYQRGLRVGLSICLLMWSLLVPMVSAGQQHNTQKQQSPQNPTKPSNLDSVHDTVSNSFQSDPEALDDLQKSNKVKASTVRECMLKR